MADNSIDLDLDALAPAKVTINYQEQLIEVLPLSLEQFTRLFTLSNQLGKLDDTGDPEAILPFYDKIKQLVGEAIPGLADAQLNPTQLMALFSLLGQLATPQDKAVAELNKRGINVNKDTGDPKALTS